MELIVAETLFNSKAFSFIFCIAFLPWIIAEVPMKRSCFLLVSGILFAALLFSCAGQPKPAGRSAAAPAIPEKQRKERSVPVKVPVLVKETSLYADGLVDEYVVYKYDDALAALVEKDSFDGSRPDPFERVVVENAAGRMAADTVYDTDGKAKVRHEYSYAKAGLLTQERILDSKGNPQSSSTYSYNASGARTEWRAFDGKGVLKAVTRYSYEKGKIVLIDMSDANGARTGSIVTEYDAAGLPFKRSYKAADGSLQKYELSTFDSGKAMVVETHHADDALAFKIANTYGPLGELLSATTTDASGAVKDRRTYEYRVRQDTKTEVYYE
jgi:YD repeat-containing protein